MFPRHKWPRNELAIASFLCGVIAGLGAALLLMYVGN